MKKLLALVLALVMVMSLCITSNAAFTDAEDVNYDEAVGVMSMVGVLKGYEDGSFQAKKTVTRAEAAKIIAYLDLGEKAAEALTKDVTPFSDVAAGNWATGYITYCYNAGIIAGVGNGAFAPNDQVTALQFAKMLLVVLGYKADEEGMTGVDWALATAKLAATAGLFEGNDAVSVNAAATREEAALYAFNALNADCVQYAVGSTTVSGKDFTVTVGGSAASKYNGAYDTKFDDDDDYLQLGEKLFKGELVLDKSEGVEDDYNRPGYTWTYDDDDVFVADKAVKVYTASTKASVIEKDLKNYKAGANKVQADVDGGYDAEDLVFVDGAEAADLEVGDDKCAADAIAALTKNGTAVEIYANDDKEIEAIVVVNTYLGKVKEAKADKVDDALTDATVVVYANGSSSEYKFDDQKTFAYEKDEYVLLNKYGTKYEIVGVPTTVEGTAATQADKYYTVDGTKYTLAQQLSQNNAEDDYTGTYTFYLDQYGYILGSTTIEAGAANAQFAYLKATEVTAKTNFKDAAVKAKVTFMDGETKVVNLQVKNEKLSGASTKTWNVWNPAAGANHKGAWIEVVADNADTPADESQFNALANHFYRYTENSDGTYTLKALNSDYESEVTYVPSSKVTAKTFDDYSSDASTELLFVDGGKSYTGYKNFPTSDDITIEEGSADALVTYAKGKTVAKTIYVIKEAKTVEDITYAYSTSDVASYTSGGDDYYEFYVDGEVVYYQVDEVDGSNGNSVEKNVVYSIKLTDGVADLDKIEDNDVYSGSVHYFVTDVEVKSISGGDYFTATNNDVYNLGYEEDEAVCGIYDLGDDGAETSLAEEDHLTVVYIVDGGENYALAIYVAEA